MTESVNPYCAHCHYWKADKEPEGLGACQCQGYSMSTVSNMRCDWFKKKRSLWTAEEVREALSQVQDETERYKREGGTEFGVLSYLGDVEAGLRVALEERADEEPVGE